MNYPDSNFINKALLVAETAATHAGKHMLNARVSNAEIEFKGATDLVTRYDRECQEIISSEIRSTYPSHSVTGEEDLEHEGTSDYLWLIDPIDGTTNFAHRLPMFCVSIALLYMKKPIAGVVYIPVLDQLFKGALNLGATLNNSTIEVSETTLVADSLLATGFPYDRRDSDVNNVNNFNAFILKCRGIRRMGSAAIDLCYTAAGILDGYWELKLKPWDSAAGAIILQESGGTITGFQGEEFDPYSTWCLASNGRIHLEMVKILNKKKPNM